MRPFLLTRECENEGSDGGGEYTDGKERVGKGHRAGLLPDESGELLQCTVRGYRRSGKVEVVQVDRSAQDAGVKTRAPVEKSDAGRARDRSAELDAQRDDRRDLSVQLRGRRTQNADDQRYQQHRLGDAG